MKIWLKWIAGWMIFIAMIVYLIGFWLGVILILKRVISLALF
jgi:hypothetical protein